MKLMMALMIWMKKACNQCKKGCTQPLPSSSFVELFSFHNKYIVNSRRNMNKFSLK